MSISQHTASRQRRWLPEGLRAVVTLPNLIGLAGAILALVLLIRLPQPWNIRATVYLMLLIWTILRPRVALYLMPIAVPWGSLDSITVAGLSLNSADILVFFLAAGWLMGCALRPATYRGEMGIDDAGPRDRAPFDVPWYLIASILLLLAAMFLSMTVAVDIRASLKEIAKWIEFLLLILFGTQYIRTRRQLWIIVVLILLAGISQAFYGYFQYFYNLGPASFVRDASLRVYGTFGQPNPFAGYINMPLCVAVSLMLLGRTWLTRFLAGIATVLLGAAIYLSQSRGAELALAVALLFILFVGIPALHRPFGIAATFGGVVIGALCIGLIPLAVFNPLLRQFGLTQISFTAPTNADYSTAERIAHWVAGIRMFMTHPFLGVGIGNYGTVYPNYYATIFVNSLAHAHNYYINAAAEMGAIGLTVFLLFIMAQFVAGGSAFRHVSARFWEAKTQATTPRPAALRPVEMKERRALLLHPIKLIDHYRPAGIHGVAQKLGNDRALAVGLLAALLTVCVHNLVDDLYVHSMTNLMALLLIMLIAMARISQNP
jgi:O-antigen ligase